MKDGDDLGIHITKIAGRTSIVRVKVTYDGGMVEFWDPITGVNRGCAGINWWKEKKHHTLYTGPLPVIPDEDRWIV